MSKSAILSLLLPFFFGLPLVNAQYLSQDPVPNVYLDCSFPCDTTYIRTNITQVNYVRDQDDAGIYLRITSASTGGGREYVIDLRGMPSFFDRHDTLTYYTPNTATNDEERAGLVRYIQIGLVPFLTNTIAMQNLDIIYSAPEISDGDTVGETTDPWNYWVFDVGVDGALNGQSSDKTVNAGGYFDFERITEQWKISGEIEGNFNRREVELSSGVFTINRDSWSYSGMAAYSISDHASIGLFTEASNTRTGNLKLNVEAAPAFQYSVFPYREFQERRIYFTYRVTPSYRNYFDTTIYSKDSETIVRQVLSTQLRYDQPWGFINVSASASNYFHDLSINRFEFNPSLNIRIIRGLNLSVSGRYRSINDQISLPAGTISDEDALTGARQRATTYDYRVSFGLSYTFGSKFSTVVNPRF